ncbi:TonB-dependent receptor [Yeosuana sp. MJ-SS3]|uniref:TonB-dependent receptor n=1 Tax=Gilvirhabdus luticola TaxID=3079858 RepID=A0ABU3U718_9FLAO|nr:TonB-dependent receptor [Yeosuana sp. MJ-SS3]MDU8886191.1 TonB-dependent receptor [Yeosuana sp. MJ-SS3]
MTKTILALIFISFSLHFLNAQPPTLKEVKVSGKVLDQETNQPLEYATITFYNIKEQKMTTGGITDANGNFSIPVEPGIYNITIEYLSYKAQTLSNKRIVRDENLGTFSLETDTESLEEVEIIAERTTVELKLDKKIYNVGKDLTVSGGTVSDVLDNIPSVSINSDGNVALRGNESVRILIDGKPSALVGLNSNDALKQLPAESIEKVEVITSPSARYESEGTAGIINIILRRSKLQGLNGAISANIGDPTQAGISGNINYRTGDVNFFNTTGYSYRETPGYWINNTRYKDTGNYLDENRQWTDISKGLTTNFGIEWYVNNSSSITTSIVYRKNDNEDRSITELLQYDADRLLIDETIRINPELNDNKTIQYAFNYSKNFKTSGHKLTFDFQYEDSDSDMNSTANENGIDVDKLSRIEDESNILLRSDYVLPIGENSQFEFGYRGDFNTTTTDYEVRLFDTMSGDFEIDTNLSNLFNFKNYINAVYAQYGTKINNISYLLGLRMENTQTTLDQPTSGDFEKKNYTGLFPTLNINYEFSEDESLTFGYNRRLRRPWSFFLNPFPSRSSLTNVFQGNPDLDPTYSDKFEIGYLNRLDKVTISTAIYYQHSNDLMRFISRDSGETVIVGGQEVPVIQRGPVNIGTQDELGFELNVSYSPIRKWRINTDINLNNEEVNGDFENLNFDSKNFNWSVRLNNKYTLPLKIDWQTNLRYRGPRKDAQNDSEGRFNMNLAFSKDLFKDNGSLAFNINNLFNSPNRKGISETPTFITDTEVQYRGPRSYNLSFTYRFNQKKKRERRGGNFEGGGPEIDL